MNQTVATRSALIELREEQVSMREGYGFLDEKCLLLAGATLRELQQFQALWSECQRLQTCALAALDAALGRHGLAQLLSYPLAEQANAAPGEEISVQVRSIMGVKLQSARCEPRIPAARWPLQRSPEAADCAETHAAWLTALVQLAAVAGNLERLHHEYRRTARRARALDSVLLPELATEVRSIGTQLEEQEQEDAICMRQRPE